MNKISYIPKGYNAVIPALAFHGADSAIKWYANNFGAKEKMRFNSPDGTIAHAEITLGDNVIMVSEENLQYNKSPKTLKGNSVNLCIYVPDVDAVIKKAIHNGAKLLIEPADQFYGDRSGGIKDPSEKEMKKAMDEMAQEQHA